MVKHDWHVAPLIYANKKHQGCYSLTVPAPGRITGLLKMKSIDSLSAIFLLFRKTPQSYLLLNKRGSVGLTITLPALCIIIRYPYYK